QGRRLSFGAVDADLLHQPRRQDAAENATRKAGAREGRAEASIRERVRRASRHSSDGAQNPLTVIPREGGVSNTPRLLGQPQPSLEYWIVRSSRTTTPLDGMHRRDRLRSPSRRPDIRHEAVEFFTQTRAFAAQG